MNLQPRGSHRARSPSLLRQARDDEITDIMEELMRTSARPTVRDKEREEE